MTEWFSTWFDTEYYHLLYNNRSYAEADAFVERLFEANILDPSMRILELACGKGRHAIAMHRFGAEVVGVDLSVHSIAAATASEEPGLQFYVQDMRLPFPETAGSFDACTNLFTSFGYFDSEAENSQVLQNIARVLRPGGRFVLDFMNAKLVAKHLPPVYTERRGQAEFLISKEFAHGQIIKTITVMDAGVQKGVFEERVQALNPDRLENLCQAAGLHVQHMYGNYELAPLQEATSERCILICSA